MTSQTTDQQLAVANVAQGIRAALDEGDLTQMKACLLQLNPRGLHPRHLAYASRLIEAIGAVEDAAVRLAVSLCTPEL